MASKKNIQTQKKSNDNQVRFKPKDIVTYSWYGGHEAEIMDTKVLSFKKDNLNQLKYEITYPTSYCLPQRCGGLVGPGAVEKKRKISNSVPKPQPLNDNTDVNDDMEAFVRHITMEEAMKLSVHEKIDHRDPVGRFVFATVMEKRGSNLKIHYDGWSRRWDVWSNFNVELQRFAVAGSISLRPSHRAHFSGLKKGDYVDINPSQRHFGWKIGEIRRLDNKSGQVQVVYEHLNTNYLYWAHLDNGNEIALFGTKSRVLEKVDKPQAQPPIEDELEARRKRFPRYPNEEIRNKHHIGERLEVQDTQTLQWIASTVIDKENNWICVHFTGWPSKYDQKIHVMKHAQRLRPVDTEEIDVVNVMPQPNSIDSNNNAPLVEHGVAIAQDKEDECELLNMNVVEQDNNVSKKQEAKGNILADTSDINNNDNHTGSDRFALDPFGVGGKAFDEATAGLAKAMPKPFVVPKPHHIDDEKLMDFASIVQEKQSAVKLWLTKEVQLPQYIDLFMDEGYDEMDTIVKTVTDEDLLEIGIKKRGHRKKILLFIHELKNNNPSNQIAAPAYAQNYDEELEGLHNMGIVGANIQDTAQ
eukprot:72865_1